MTHICISKLTIIGSDNGLSHGRRQAIIWTNAGILSIRTLGTNFSEILGVIHSFSFSKMHLKMSAKWGVFGLSLNELKYQNSTILSSMLFWSWKWTAWLWIVVVQKPNHIVFDLNLYEFYVSILFAEYDNIKYHHNNSKFKFWCFLTC